MSGPVGDALSRSILDNIADAILVADDDARYIDANRAAVELLGWSREELLSMRVADIVVAGAEWAEPEFASFATAGQWRGEVEVRRKDGYTLTVESHASSIELPDRRLHVAVLRDVSHRVSLRNLQSELLAREQDARLVAEQASERLALVSEISELLAEWVDYPAALTRLARLLTTRLADICVIDLLDENGRVRREAAVHADPAQQPLVDRLRDLMPLDAADHPTVSTMRNGASHYADVDDALIDAIADSDAERDIVQQLGYRSYVAAPLNARERIIGAIALVSTSPQRRFTADDLPALEEIARRVAVRIDNARLYAERDEIASALQSALLPARLPRVAGLDLAAAYRTAGRGQVGGDFYDVVELPDGSVLLVIGDVCGKGPQAAAVTGLARHTVRAVSIREGRPERVLGVLNDVLLNDPTSTRFVTACCVRLDPQEGRAELCLAGHPPPVLVRDGRASVVSSPSGLLLGEFADVDLASTTVQIEPSDGLVLFTDGLIGGGGDVDSLVRDLVVDRGADAAGLVEAALGVGAAEPPVPELADDVAVVAVVRSA